MKLATFCKFLCRMLSLALGSLFATLVPLSNTFTIYFNCRPLRWLNTWNLFWWPGNRQSDSNSNATDSTELINAPRGSFNVIAHPNHGKDDKTAVAFCSNPDCAHLIGFSNVPSCVGAGAYRSYEIIQISDDWAGKYNLQPPETVSQKPNATATRVSGQLLPTGYVNSSSTRISFHFSSTLHKTSFTLHPITSKKPSITSPSTSTTTSKSAKAKSTATAKWSLP